MDIRGIHYWVTQAKPTADGGLWLHGEEFVDGVLREPHERASSPSFWWITPTSPLSVTGNFELVHVNSKGYFLRWSGNQLPELPCLLTNDGAIRKVFAGTVVIRDHEGNIVANDLIGDGMPLAGDHWVGMAWHQDDHIHMEVYSDRPCDASQPWPAFCAWWSAPLDEDDCMVFQVEPVKQPSNQLIAAQPASP